MRKLCLIMVTCLVIFACKKGDPGVTGPAGPAGPQGLQGVQGVKGDNGSTIFSGNDVPEASLGSSGDYYFRSSNSMFYGPKTAAGWGTPVSLRGANGAAGAPGSKIWSGTALPATDVGSVGDFYFKSDTYLLFGPKTASGWGSGINLKGGTGTANVIYSGWIKTTYLGSNVRENSQTDYYSIAAPRITQNFLNNAVILVYGDFKNNPMYPQGVVAVLPYSYVYSIQNNQFWIAWQASIQLGEIRLEQTTKPYSASAPLVNFRYVIIPGGVVATFKNNIIDLNNSLEVEKYLQSL